MRFLVDECCGPVIARWLKTLKHDVQRVAEISPGLDDGEVLRWACREERILITSDKDFGARIFENHEPHRGVIFLRLSDERPVIMQQILAGVLQQFGENIKDRFIVATERHVRASNPFYS